MSRFLKRAIKDRYLTIDKKQNTVTYLPQGKRRVLSNPEEQVQLDTYLDLIYQYQYPPEKIRVCEPVKIGSSSREADIMIFHDNAGKDPYIVVECKKKKVSASVFEGAIDQGFSYAASTNAEYVWATSGDKNAYFEVWDKAINERKRNRISSIPKHQAEKKFGSSIRRSFRYFVQHPILSDTILFAMVLLLSVVVFSKLTVAYHDEIKQLIGPYWAEFGMDYNWFFNGIVGASTLFTFFFGRIFMRSHKFFMASRGSRRLTLLMIVLVLFLPAWYLGVSNSDPSWWTPGHYDLIDWKAKIYLWPYVKSMVPQILAIYGLIWLMGRGKKQ